MKRIIKLQNDFEVMLEMDDLSLTCSVWKKDDTMPTGWAYIGENAFTLPEQVKVV